MTKMQKRMKKIFKKNKFSFDISETLLEVDFEIFCEFYENGDLNIVDWEYDNDHKETKKSMDHLYFYWTVLRPKHKKMQDKLLDIYYGEKNYKVTFEDEENGNKLMKTESIFPEYKYGKLHKIAEFLKSCEQRNLELLVRIRDYLWT